MRSILFLFTVSFFFISCSSTKKPIANPEPVKEVMSKETPVVQSPKTPEVIEEEETIVEVTPSKNAEPIIIEKVNHAVFNDLLHKYVSNDGNVNYKGFIKDKGQFKIYLTDLAENLPKDDWTIHDKLAYWMNVYNAYTIKLIIDHYPIKSIKEIKDPWDTRFFKLGAKWYNLNEVEHKILRKMNDPRIHFGINCASFSCPPILNKAFTAQNVNQELDQLAIRFINDKQRNNISENSIQVSKIFQWFAKDFKTQGSLIDFLNKYAEVAINPKAKKTYKKYNWSLNE